jgi:3-deoxy-D-manno-oct-2-ulosonic acid (Kdo) hydroxylase
VRAVEVGATGDVGGVDPYSVLESGDILVIPRSFFEEAPEDREFLLCVRSGEGQYHKNVAYRPNTDRISGFGKMEPASVDRLRAILRDYSRRAVGFTGRLLPRYQAKWRLDFASLRPVEEAGRELPLKKRNDLLHTDAFPTRPTNGGLILRFFTNVHPSKSRVWVTSDPFGVAAARYAREAGLDGFARGSMHRLRQALAYIGLAAARRSRYDEFMLFFHDYLKRNAEYQRSCPKYRLEFPPGTSWMAFTDIVPHSVESGQSALEQTFIVSPDSLASQEKSPLAILEKLAGRPLRSAERKSEDTAFSV